MLKNEFPVRTGSRRLAGPVLKLTTTSSNNTLGSGIIRATVMTYRRANGQQYTLSAFDRG